jgi:hypothetical protein
MLEEILNRLTKKSSAIEKLIEKSWNKIKLRKNAVVFIL